MIDLETSRRDCFLRCAYWKQIKEDYISDDKIVYETEPSGFFYAKEISTYNISSNVIGGVFMATTVRLTIETKDDIHELERNDIVIIDKKKYRVDDIQITPIKKQRQFRKHGNSNSYTIALVG